MTLFLILVILCLVVVLLSAGRVTLRALPEATTKVPSYVLWLTGEGQAPALSPRPTRIHRGPEPPTGSKHVLLLSTDTDVAVDLPGRLAACGSDFVSVLPEPSGSPLAVAMERSLRDAANIHAVTDLTSSVAYADERCLWAPESAFRLPSPGGPIAVAAARSRKYHGLPVDLRSGLSSTGRVVSSPGLTKPTKICELLSDEPIGRYLFATFLIVVNVAPLAGLFVSESRAYGIAALGLLTFIRLFTALREGFGLHLSLLGPVTDLWLACALLTFRPPRPEFGLPDAPESPGPSLTAARPTEARFLDSAATTFLARRLGGSGLVMERIYECIAGGSSPIGLQIDRWIHSSSSARAIRWRWLIAGELIRRMNPASVLSIPSGTGREFSWSGIQSPHLWDPDPAVHRLLERRMPAAHRVVGGIDDLRPSQYQMVVYMGLSEYVGDGELRRHLHLLCDQLEPNGMLITSMTAEHGQRERMSRWLGWSTRARTPEALTDVLISVGLRIELVMHDPNRIQWIFLARKPLA